MAIPPVNFAQPLPELTTYLFTRREAILNRWRLTCEQDPSLSKVFSLSREEFNNLLPLILDALEKRLLNKPLVIDPTITAQGHGLHRWHKAYGLIDTINELNHFAQTLYSELKEFSRLFPHVDKESLLDAQQRISQLMQLTINGSVVKYDELQRLQATNRADTLHMAIDQMHELSKQRGNVLRESTHDLRSSFGIVNSAVYLLEDEKLGKQDRERFIDMLNRNLGNLEAMLTSLMDLSRLEAGQEPVKIESVDAARLLQDIVASAQSVANERGIILQSDGPSSLVVETDRIKLQRIVQNLLLNAINYTTATSENLAIVSVSWSLEGESRWVFSIQDSGPGLPSTTVGTLGQQLRPTVEPTSVLDPNQAEPVAVVPNDLPQISVPAEIDSATRPVKGGEGVGLQIVKRLCELLNANIDVESIEGRGTLFRIRVPVRINS